MLQVAWPPVNPSHVSLLAPAGVELAQPVKWLDQLTPATNNVRVPNVSLSTGISMFYQTVGEGEPIVLIMGTGADHTPWDATAQAYAANFRVITFDQRGTGRTDRPEDPGSYSARGMADDVAALLDCLGVGVCHVSGMSLGSAIAQELAINHPDKVASLQLHCTWGRTDDWLRRVFESLQYLLERPTLDAYFHTDNVWIYSADFLNRDPRAMAAEEAQFLRDPYAPTHVTLRGHLHADLMHDSLDRLHNIKVPTLITSGEMDWQVPTRYGRAVHQEIAGSRLHVFQGSRSSHNAFFELAPEFNELTLRFLADTAPRI